MYLANEFKKGIVLTGSGKIKNENLKIVERQ